MELEQVLHAQHGALPGPRRRHRQQHGGLPVAVVGKPLDGVQLHGSLPFSIGVVGRFVVAPVSVARYVSFRLPPLVPARCPLDHLGLLRRGLDADGEAVPLGQEQAVPTRARKQPALEVFGQVEGVADRAYRRRVLLKQQLEGGVLQTTLYRCGR